MNRALGVLALAGLGACQPEAGSERGPCYGNGTCDAGLVCASNVCVAPPDGATAQPPGTAQPGTAQPAPQAAQAADERPWWMPAFLADAPVPAFIAGSPGAPAPAASAEPAGWRYALQPGRSYRYRFEADTRTSGTLPGVGRHQARQRTHTDFDVRVLGVRPDGAYDVEVQVVAASVDGGGQRMDLTQVARDARVQATLTPSGRFHFHQRLVVASAGEAMVVASVRVDPEGLSVSQSLSVDGQQVEVVGAVDPATGRASSRVRVNERQAAAALSEDHIDLLPVELLALLELPTGPTGTDAWDFEALGMRMQGRPGAPVSCGSRQCPTFQLAGSGTFSEETLMPGLEGLGDPFEAASAMFGQAFGEPGRGQAQRRQTFEISYETELTVAFDTQVGQLFRVDGKQSESMRLMGQPMDSSADFSLVFVSEG